MKDKWSKEKQQLAMAWNARRCLYLLGFMKEAEHKKITERIIKFQDKHKIQLTNKELQACKIDISI